MNIRILFILIFLYIYSNASFSQETDSVLITIGSHQITKTEFLRVYKKNNDNSLDAKAIDDYLQLFINFKLKVIEAESMGMDTTSKFLNEFIGYKTQLEEPYLKIQGFDDSLLLDTYERMKYEVRVSHILIKIPKNPSPKDTLEAYTKAMEIRARIIYGENFEKVARATSDDPSVKSNGGHLGYFTVFQFVYPFETAAYNLKSGQLSMPVKTSYGYHLIKSHDKRVARGKVNASHIMVLAPESSTKDSLIKARKRIEKIYKELQNGADFDKLADDSKNGYGPGDEGGSLGWFGVGRMIPTFENAAFNLKNKGDISDIVKSNFGFHIIKLNDKKEIPKFEEIKETLIQKAKGKERENKYNLAFINHIKNLYGFEEFPEAKNELYSLIDSSVYSLKKDYIPNSSLNKVLFTLNSIEYTQKSFFNHFISNLGNNSNKSIYILIDELYENFINFTLKEYERKKLPEKYTEFKYLLDEYHDGILLFELTDNQVWSKAVKDTSGLDNFFSKNKKKYIWDTRVLASTYIFNEKSNAEKVVDIINNSNKNISLAQAAKKLKDNSLYKIETKSYYKGQNEIIDTLKWEKGYISGIIENKNSFIIAEIENILNNEPKKLDEARGIVIADYQEFLENEWINYLRKKYIININSEVLKSIKSN